MELYTIGHSNRTLAEFMHILHEQGITCIVDVRSFPMSRHVPWFNKPNLQAALKKHKISYVHMKELGGRRKALKDSVNTEWRNSGFRGYADYMQTKDFYIALKKLNTLIKSKKKVAIMCAEAVPWRCHRSLIADAEIIRGIKVIDILSATSIRLHALTSFALIDKSVRPYQIHYAKGSNLKFKI